MSEKQLQDHMKHIMSELEKLPKENRKDAAMIKVKEIFGAYLPQSLLELTSGLLLAGDSGVSIDEKPSWLDMEKFRKGQKFYQDNYSSVTYSEVVALFPLLSFDIGLNTFIFAGNSSTPYTAFKRYLSSHFRFENWYTSDPWTRGTPAYNDMRYTRKIHNIVRQRLSNASVETYENKLKLNPVWSVSTEETRQDFKSACPALIPAQCPNVFLNYFPNQTLEQINQTAMSVTQFGFCGLIICKPQTFGIHNVTDEDLEAFCHVWKGIGYLLGVDDDYNFCRGTLEDVRARAKDVLEYWVKPNFQIMRPECEHLLRCLLESIRYYFPLINFESVMLHLAEIMDVPMPRLSALLPYHIKLQCFIPRFYFCHLTKVPGAQKLMNYALKKAMHNAKKYDEEKLKQLQIKSEKTLESASWKLKSSKKFALFNFLPGLLIINLFVITMSTMYAIMFY